MAPQPPKGGLRYAECILFLLLKYFYSASHSERQIINWSNYKGDILVREGGIYSELKSVMLYPGRGAVQPTFTGLVGGEGTRVSSSSELGLDLYGDFPVELSEVIVPVLSQLIHVRDQIGVVVVYSVVESRHVVIRHLVTIS